MVALLFPRCYHLIQRWTEVFVRIVDSIFIIYDTATTAAAAVVQCRVLQSGPFSGRERLQRTKSCVFFSCCLFFLSFFGAQMAMEQLFHVYLQRILYTRAPIA